MVVTTAPISTGWFVHLIDLECSLWFLQMISIVRWYGWLLGLRYFDWNSWQSPRLTQPHHSSLVISPRYLRVIWFLC